jgi:hypothetical protein
MSQFSTGGGARIGWVNASWPFAKLTVSEAKITLSGILGRYDFIPEQVISLEPCGFFPILHWGVRINHNRADYAEKIIFWCFGSRTKLILRIGATGFVPAGSAESLVDRQKGFPIRWGAIIAFVVLWNIPFLRHGFPISSRQNFPDHFPDPGILFSLVMAFGLSWGLRVSSELQKIVLQEGHSVNEIKSFLGLIQLVSGFLFVVWFAVIFLSFK